MYDDYIISDVLGLGWSGAAELTTYDTNEDLLVDPNGTGAINLVGVTNIDGGDATTDLVVDDSAVQSRELRLGLNDTALITTVDLNENLYINPNGTGFTQVVDGLFYVTDGAILRSGISDDTGNLELNDAVDVSGLLTANGGLTVETGDALTVNGEAFTDLTGSGLQFNSGQLEVVASGGNVGGFTQGSVIFADADGTITEDNGNFFYDNTNNRLSLGDNSASARLDIDSTGTTDQLLRAYSNNTTTSANALNVFWADNAAFDKTVLNVRQDGTGDILTVQDGANTVFVVEDGGRVGIGTADPTSKLQVVDTITSNTTSTGVQIDYTWNPAAPSGTNYPTGISSNVTYDSTANSAGFLSSGRFWSTVADSGVIDVWNIDSLVRNQGTGTIPNAYNIRIRSTDNSGGGTITNNYGISIANQTAGVNDYGLYIQGADTYPLYVQSGNSYFGGNIELGDSGFTGSLEPATLGANRTYTLPDEDGIVCLTSGNCVGTGGGGAIGGSGTLNTIALFTPDGNNIGDSALTQSGSDITAAGDLYVNDRVYVQSSTSTPGFTLTDTADSDTFSVNFNRANNDLRFGSNAVANPILTLEQAGSVGINDPTPGATFKVNSLNNNPVAVFNNQTNTGDILQLQDNGSSIFTVADGGAVTAAGLTTLNDGLVVAGGSILRGGISDDGGNLELNDTVDVSGALNVTGIISTGNTATAGDLRVYDGSSNYGRFATVSDLTANRTYTLPDASGEVCISGAGNCGGGGTEDNLLRNGDFEFGHENWPVEDLTAPGLTQIVTTDSHSGAQSLQITGRKTLISTDFIPVDPDYDVLQLEAWVHETSSGTEGGNLYFGYAAYDSAQTLITSSPCGTYCYFAASNNNVTAGSWQKYSATTTGEGTVFPNFPVGTKFVRVLALVNYINTSDDQVTLIDDISVTRINNGPLFVGNNFSTSNQKNQFQVTQLFTQSDDDFVLQTGGTGRVQLGSASTGLQVTQAGAISDIDGSLVVIDDGLDVSGVSQFNDTVTISKTGDPTLLTLTDGGADDLVVSESASDYSILNTQQNNGLIIYDGTGGVDIRYNGSTIAEFDSVGVSLGDDTDVQGTLLVTGLTTLNGSLTVETGDTFTFNGDAFTDLTGTGLTISGGALTVDPSGGLGLSAGTNIDGTELSSGTIDVIDNPVFSGLITAQSGIEITSSGLLSQTIRSYNSTSDADIVSLLSLPTGAGGRIEAPRKSNDVIGVRENSGTDGFAMISGVGY